MPSFVRPTFSRLVRALRRAKYNFEARYDLFDPITVVPFRAWGTTRTLRIHGRVIERKGLNQPTPDSSVLENVANTVYRVESDEIPRAQVEIVFRGARWRVTADEEGFFRCDVPADLPLAGGWHHAGVRVVDSMAGGGVQATAEVCVPDPNADFIVVSDIDDTVVVTHVTELLDMLRRVVAGNARTRKPFAGVPEFYRALARGRSPAGNAIFYVTRTGWNFYDLMTDVLAMHDIPPGPMLMRDLAIVESRASSLRTDEQKFSKIAEVMEAFPDQRFVLIGDSGQADAEIYRDCIDRFGGGRVAAVYLRKAGGRDVADDTAAAIRAAGVPFCVAGTTLDMARHAAKHGLIAPGAAEDVAAAEAAE